MKLTQKPCLYADMLQCRNAGGKVLYETETALLLQGRISKILYSAAADEQAGKEIVEHLPKQFPILVAHDTYTDPWLKSMRRLHCELECVHCVYVKAEPPAGRLRDKETGCIAYTEYYCIVSAFYGISGK